jgi:hypothetical protein
MKPIWIIDVTIGDCGGTVSITADRLEQIDISTVLADGVQIDLGGRIEQIKVEESEEPRKAIIKGHVLARQGNLPIRMEVQQGNQPDMLIPALSEFEGKNVRITIEEV